MAKYTGPKVKLSRKLGIALTPKASKVMSRKPHPPGQLGPARRGRFRMSEYKRHLLEKQKLRFQYNISERQMVNYFQKAREIARRTGGVTTDILVQLLETRLDAVVLRGGLATTIYQARQFVSHGHILVNGQRVNVSSYAVKVGDTVSVKPPSRELPGVQEALGSSVPVPYLQLNRDEYSVKLLYLPNREEVPVIAEVPLVIEHYAR